MNAADHYGVFLPFTMRMGCKMRDSIVKRFLETGRHDSPTGTTARIVINHCLENNLAFAVEYMPPRQKTEYPEDHHHYIVRLTGATQ